jgi:peptide/nickel transport system substrate-binding protein
MDPRKPNSLNGLKSKKNISMSSLEQIVSTFRPKTRAAALFALAGLLLLFLACTPSGSREDTAALKTVVVAYQVDIDGVNELVNQSTALHNALQYFALFLPLVEIQPDYQEAPSTFLPRLAESYEFSEDHLRLTFHLRNDVVWSDGVKTTAEDVLFTWQAQTDPDIAWPFVDSKRRITKVEVLDETTVRFHFSEVYSVQLNDANLGVILPKHVWGRLPFAEWKDNSDWFVENLVVNGPFNLEAWEPGQRVVLGRNESYFEPNLPKVDRIVFEITRDSQSQLAKLRSGHAHMVEYVNPPDASQVVAHPELRLETFIPRFFFSAMWNTSRPFFAEKEVRQALTLAIDRQAIIETLHFGYGALAHSPFPSNSWPHNKAIEPWPYDPQRARELLASKGWIDHDGDGIIDRDGQPFRFELMTNSENSLRRDLTVMMQEQLRLVGIAAEPRNMEFNALLAPLSRHEFDAVVTGVAMDTSFNARFYFHTDAIKDGYNWGMFDNPEVDRLIDEIAVQIDPQVIKPLFDRLQEILHDEQPVTYLYEGRRLVGIHESLHDVGANAISSFSDMRFWRLEETK